MIKYLNGNVLDVEHNVLIVHGVNCAGVMAAGIAREIKSKYPKVFDAYRKTYESLTKDLFSTGLIPGDIEVIQVDENKFNHKYICNANTQPNFGRYQRQVDYEAMVSCFENIKSYVLEVEKQHNVKLDIVFPKIGAGLGGGDWDIISVIIDKTLGENFNKTCYVFP